MHKKSLKKPFVIASQVLLTPTELIVKKLMKKLN